jgi:hypothetical protein
LLVSTFVVKSWLVKTFGLRGTYSRAGQDKPARRKGAALLTKGNSALQTPSPTSLRGMAEETEPILNTRTSEPLNKTEIDPLRVLVWFTFALLLVSAWTGIVWAVAALT